MPIVLGPTPRKGDQVWCLMRVIERGHVDMQAHHVFFVRSDDWTDDLSPLLDFMVRDLMLEVGKRHGTWLVHVQVAPAYHVAGVPPFPPIPRLLRDREPRRWHTVRDESHWDVDHYLADEYEMFR